MPATLREAIFLSAAIQVVPVFELGAACFAWRLAPAKALPPFQTP